MTQIAPTTEPAAEPATELAAGLRRIMAGTDRHDPLGEAKFAVLEAAVRLIDADRPELAEQPFVRTELLREVLHSVRAATVAAGIAVTRADEVSRVLV